MLHISPLLGMFVSYCAVNCAVKIGEGKAALRPEYTAQCGYVRPEQKTPEVRTLRPFTTGLKSSVASLTRGLNTKRTMQTH